MVPSSSNQRAAARQSIHSPTTNDNSGTPGVTEINGGVHELIDDMLASSRKRHEVRRKQLERQYRSSVEELRADIENSFKDRDKDGGSSRDALIAELNQLLEEEEKIVAEIQEVTETLQQATKRRKDELRVVLVGRQKEVENLLP